MFDTTTIVVFVVALSSMVLQPRIRAHSIKDSSSEADTSIQVKSKEGCRKPAYVVFAVDRRASIKDQDLNEQVDLIHTIIRDFSSNHSMVRFALLTFGEGIRAEFGFGDNSSTDAAVLGISGTGLALQNIREVMRNGKRFGVPQIAIVISNGESDFLEETRTEAENVRSEGIILFSVGLGTDVDLESLGVIASKKEFVFEGASHAVFEALESALYTVICN